jgi:iron(III) transport system substrate-binding protein
MKPRIIFFALGLVLALYNLPLAWGQADATKRLIDGAKKEGKVVWYTALSIQDAEVLTKRFEQTYPFIKTETLRLVTDALLTKILTETKAGVHNSDVIEIPGIAGNILKKEGLFDKYASTESNAYPATMKDPEGTWTSFFIHTLVLVYNTQLVKKEELPRTYQDLINPKWKGKIVLRDEDFETFGMMLKVMGREKGMNFMRRLGAQGVDLRNSFTLAVQGVASGEIPLGMNLYGTHTEEFKKKGAPVDWVPMEFVLTTVEPLAVSARAPHPAAARLFIDFLLSKEAQSILRDRSRISSRPDVPPDPPALTKGLKLIPTDLSLADQANELAKEFRAIFKPR